MSAERPNYILFSESKTPLGQTAGGHWRFVLAAVDGGMRFEVADRESDVAGDRLALLSVLRGLEALDQPATVKLHTKSRYVWRGFRYGLPSWRLSNWCWESFGVMKTIANSDLWRRIDQALTYHRVHCHAWQGSEQLAGQPRPASRMHGWLADDSPRSRTDQAAESMAGWAGVFQPNVRVA
jgi:ribonuclease HI